MKPISLRPLRDLDWYLLATMLKRAGQNIRPHLRRLHQQARHAATSVPRSQGNAAAAAVLASGIAAGSYLWYTNSQRIYNDADLSAGLGPATPLKSQTKRTTPDAKLWEDPNTLHALVWGSNKCVSNFSRAPLIEGTPFSVLAAWICVVC